MRNFLKFQIISIILICILGCILHFVYEFSNDNFIVGIFTPINESIWEHLKLTLYPMLLTLLIGLTIFKDTYSNFICGKTISIIFAIFFIPIFFYSYTFILGTHNITIDILSFILSVILGELIAYIYIINDYPCNIKSSISILIFLILLFTLFTFYPPHLELFKDYQSSTYGIYKFN